MGFFDKIKQGLTKTKTKMDAQLTGIFAAYEPGDEEFFEDLEETLILADTGVETTTKAIAQLRKAIELKKLRTGAEVKKEFVQILTRILKVQDTMLLLTTQPSVVLVVGVNGVGKTTTIGKLAAQLKKEGNRVLLSAADTFRAAAADSSPSGRSVRVWTSSSMKRAPTPPPWCLTTFRRRRPAARTSSSSTPPAACTTRQTS